MNDYARAKYFLRPNQNFTISFKVAKLQGYLILNYFFNSMIKINHI